MSEVGVVIEGLPGGVENALAAVFDPCSVAVNAPLSVREMGLVNECVIDESGCAHITLIATNPFCTLIGSIMQAVEEQVARVSGITAVDVKLDSATWWTPELMTEEGRSKLESRREESRRRLPLLHSGAEPSRVEYRKA